MNDERHADRTATFIAPRDNTPPPSPVGGECSIATAAISWLVALILTLATSALRVPLFAGHSEPAENLALDHMLVVQIALSAMLSPILFCSWRRVLWIMLIGIPFTQLATAMSGRSMEAWAVGAVHVCLWQLTLSFLMRCVYAARSRLLISTFATSYTLGAIVLLFVRSRPVGAADFLARVGFDPLQHALAQLHSRVAWHTVWWPVALCVLAATLYMVTRQRLSRPHG